MTQPDPGAGSSSGPRRWGVGGRGWRRVLWWGGAGVFATMLWLPTTVANPLTQSPVLMVGPIIAGYARMMVGLAVGCLGLWAACFVLWLIDMGLVVAGRDVRRRSGLRWRVVRIVGSASAGIVGMAAMVVCCAVFLTSGPDARMPFRVLGPPSDSGCRIITWKEPVDLAYGSRVSVYVARPGAVLVRATGVGWRVTGSQDPVAAGAWSLSWDKDHAHLALSVHSHGGNRMVGATVEC